jgi:hypothetical protein
MMQQRLRCLQQQLPKSLHYLLKLLPMFVMLKPKKLMLMH